MITPNQIEELAVVFKIDQVSIFREYLQLQFLNYLYHQPLAEKLFFQGGTAIHLLFHSPRLSEDLDFMTIFSKPEIKVLIKAVEKEMVNELPGLNVKLYYQGKKTTMFKVFYQSRDFKYPFTIRLDFNEEETALKKTSSSPLVTKFPIILFPVVNHLSPEEILAEKIRAFLTRGKGRDVFDIWFMLEKSITLDLTLVEKKLGQINKKFRPEFLIKKISRFPQRDLERDLNKFLPQPHRKITPTLKKRLLEKLKDRSK